MLSTDGVNFEFAPDVKAYSRTISFADGTSETAFHLERPNTTFKNGKPLFFCAAYGVDGAELSKNGNPQFDTMTMSKTLVILLESD